MRHLHHDKKAPMGRMVGQCESIDPCRLLAVAVIGDALHDLTGISRSNNQGHKLTGKRLIERIANAKDFLASPDLDRWAQFTNLDADQWRSIARSIRND